MTNEQFQKILDCRLKKIVEVLAAKRQEYAGGHDRLHNFKRAAAMRQTTPQDALMGMLTKHLVSIEDMVQNGKDFGQAYFPAQWEEKIGDAINYLILLEALVKEKAE